MAICGRIIHFDDLYAKLPRISHFTGISQFFIEHIANNLVIVSKYRYHNIGIVMNWACAKGSTYYKQSHAL